MKNPRLRATAVALTGLLGLAMIAAPPPATAAAPTTDIRPAALDKGDPGYVPHVDGDGLLVGDSRYDFAGREVHFLGYRGSRYVVGTYRPGRPRTHRVVAVRYDNHRRILLEGVSVPELTLSADGDHLFRSTYRPGRQRTTVRAWSTATGEVVASPSFRGYADVLDAFDGVAVLGATRPARTFSWKVASGATKRISGRQGYAADVRHDRLASLTADPWQDGCSVVSTIADPRERLWRSCRQAVVEFSPGAGRVVTTDLRADGLGPGQYQLREVTGEHLRTFTAHYFGRVWWEADEVLLMHAHGKRKHAWVRCDETGDCERTSRLRRTDG